MSGSSLRIPAVLSPTRHVPDSARVAPSRTCFERSASCFTDLLAARLEYVMGSSPSRFKQDSLFPHEDHGVRDTVSAVCLAKSGTPTQIFVSCAVIGSTFGKNKYY